MARTPTPVVMLSGLGDAEMVMAALESGAVDFVHKPSGTVSIDLYKVGAELVRKVKLAMFSRLTAFSKVPTAPRAMRVHSVRASRPLPNPSGCVAIGASTGGPGAISQILRGLPHDFPSSVLIVQHMPVGFTEFFAARLHRELDFDVVEADDGALLRSGTVYIAPGGAHLMLGRSGRGFVLSLAKTAPVNAVRPSIDVLMTSVAETCGADAIGILLTGMGRDGAQGLAAIHNAGGQTIVQDRDTSTIFGMPRAAIRMGVVDHVLPLPEIAPMVLSLLQAKVDAGD
jgi:two-component system chemotaxis response regulator CheB